MVVNHLPSLFLSFLVGRCEALFSLLQSLRVGFPFKVHIVRGCIGFEVLIDVLAHMFDEGVGFSLESCMRGRLLWLEMLSHNVYGHLLFQLRMRSWSNGGRMRAMSMVGAIWKKDFEVECFELPPLHGGGCRGTVFIVQSINLLGIS